MAKAKRPSPESAAFEAAASQWLDESCRLFPEAAGKLGFHDFDPLLGANTPEVHRENIRLQARTLEQLEAVPAAALNLEERLDRRGLVARMRTGLFFDRQLERWRTDPQVHCRGAIDSIFDLLLRSPDNPAAVLPAVESRLEKIPDFLQAGLACVRRPVPLWRDLALSACEGAVEFLQGLQTELAAVSENPVRTVHLLQGAIGGFQDFAGGLARKAEGSAKGYAIGREGFEFLIREQLGLDFSLNEARAAGLREIERQSTLLEKTARTLGRRPANELLERAAGEWTPGMPLLEQYRQTTFALRDRLRELDLVSLPGRESLRVLPVPAFLRNQFPTAAYSAPEPFSNDQTGIFWVNDLSLVQSSQAAKQREIRQHHGLALTCVHEAYPGHHLQFVVQFRHPSRWRRLFAHAIFYEGWTMWCERLAVEHGLVDDPLARLVQIHDALWRAHRIVIDCGLQEGSLSPQAASRRLMQGVGFTKARATADVNWYTSSPTIPMSYLLGRLEVEALHEKLVLRGDWSLRRFNDWLLSHGAIPFRWFA